MGPLRISFLALLIGVACSPTKRNYDDAEPGGGGGSGMGDGGATSSGMAGGVGSGDGGGPGDTDGPTILKVSPEDGESDVSIETVVSVLFSEDVKDSTLNADSFNVRNQVSGLVNSSSVHLEDGVLGVFTQDSPLQRGTMYTATITTDVTDLAGNSLASEKSWSFVTEAPSWGTAERLEAGSDGGTAFPQIAVDAKGNAIAVWQRWDNTRTKIWANRYLVGSGWGTATPIEPDNQGDATYPQVAVDPKGNAVAVWQQGDDERIWANRYVVGSGWGTAELITSDDASNAHYPQVAIDPAGNAVAVWSQADVDEGSSHVWANRYDVESGWGTATMVDDTGTASNPQVAIDAAGNVVAVWEQWDGTRKNIRANRYVVGSGWGTATLIEAGAGAARYPQVAISPGGSAVVTWIQSDGTFDRAWGNRYDVESGWGTATVIQAEELSSNLHMVEVGVDPAGNAVVVWSESDGSAFTIRANRYDIKLGWGTPAVIFALEGQSHVQVAVDPAGNAVAVGLQWDGTRTNVWANRYVAGSGWGTATLIETDNAGNVQHPQVAIGPAGDAVAVWSQFDGTTYSTWANGLQ